VSLPVDFALIVVVFVKNKSRLAIDSFGSGNLYIINLPWVSLAGKVVHRTPTPGKPLGLVVGEIGFSESDLQFCPAIATSVPRSSF